MAKLIRGAGEIGPESAPPDAVREAREALGWTQERLAEEVGVLPAEVAAWESGAIALTPYRAAEVRWRMDRAAYEAALPRSGCYWTRANAERLERMKAAAPRLAVRADREREAHARECAECLRVKALLRDAPPPPEPPLRPGPAGWMDAWHRTVDHLPAGLRMPARLAEALFRLGVYYVGLQLVFDLVGADGFDLSFRDLVLLVGAFFWFMAVGQWLEPLEDRNPYLSSTLQAAAVAVPANLVLGLLGTTDLASPATWIVAAIIVILAGGFLGAVKEGLQDEDERALEPERATEDGPEEEREVFIPQRGDGYWRP
jgi:transcriptional regulator with XRE-family HTH domain